MKVILTGSTGFIGREVLSQCLQNPAITSVVAISRRDLPAHEKLQVALVEDFLSYPDCIRDQLKNADACIWALGKARMPNNETARIVSLDYTLAAVRVFQDICQQPFRFIYCSGGAAERDQTKSLWFMQDYRRIRGQVENELLVIANKHPGFGVYILRPAMVLARDMSLRSLAFGLGPSVKVDDLARAMIRLAMNAANDVERNIWENTDINKGL